VADRRGRPLLFLDVDGTVLPAGGAVPPATLGEWNTRWQNAANPQLARISPGLGPRLLALPADLVWATAWMTDANTVIGPLLGLPELPVAALGALPGAGDPVWSEHDPAAALNWKTRRLVALAAGRPFAWVDDELTGTDRAWVAAHHPAPALLHRVDSQVGLTGADLAAVGNWLRSLSPAAAPQRAYPACSQASAGGSCARHHQSSCPPAHSR
jgi:hypothetical protein